MRFDLTLSIWDAAGWGLIPGSEPTGVCAGSRGFTSTYSSSLFDGEGEGLFSPRQR